MSACTGAGSGDQDAVGTTVYKPQPALSIFPDFDENVPESALSSSASSSSASLIATARAADDLDVTQLWNSVFAQGSLAEARTLRGQLVVFGDLIASSMAAAGITAITDQTQSFDTTSAANLVDTEVVWQVSAVQENGNTDYTRLYFTNTTTGKVQGTYVFKTNADGTPQRGIFAYTNPKTTTGTQLIALAFDFSDSTKNRLTMRNNKYNQKTQTFFVYQTLEQAI